MDLVAGVKTIYVITQHTTRTGEPKLVDSCTYPLTSPGVVDRIYTDLAVIDIVDGVFQVVELSPGLDFDYVRERTAGEILPVPDAVHEVK
jgi:3-oxoadipate CoA-transferase beta subunit